MIAKHLIVSCPAKVIIHGEHAVVYGKNALGSSINLRTYGTLKQTIDESTPQVLHIIVPQLTVDYEWPMSSFKDILRLDCSSKDEIIKSLEPYTLHVATSEHSSNRLAVLLSLYLFTQILDVKSLSDNMSMTLFIMSEGPLGAGLGSSAAISVCVSALFIYYSHNIALNNNEQQDKWELLHHPLLIEFLGTNKLQSCSALDDKMLQMINEWAFAADSIVHGTPSGIDNTICTYGGTLLFKEGQMTRLKPFSEEIGLKILIIDSQIPKSTKKMVSNVRDKHDTYPTIINPILDSISCITVMAIDEFKQLLDQISSPPDYSKIEELIRINQCLLSALGVSHPILDGICSLANKYGFPAKLTGGGGGGCVIVLITSANEDKLKDLLDTLSQEGYPSWVTKLGVSGITMHSIS